LNEQEQETSSLEKTPVQLSKIQKTDEKGKGMGNSLKPKPYSSKIKCFILPEIKKAYRTNFSRKNVFGECEVSISNLSDIVFTFIEEIFTKKQMGKVDSRAPAPYVKIVREFYAKYDMFDLDEKSITSKVRG